MMLQALVAYADREGLLSDLDFVQGAVDYELRIAEDGTFIGLVSLAQDERRPQLQGLPRGPVSRTNPGSPGFVVDNAQYVLGTAKETEKEGNAQKSFLSFRALVGEAAHECNDPALLALWEFLNRPDEIARADADLARGEGKKSDQRSGCVLVPALDIDRARRIHERSAVAAWWRARCEKERVLHADGPLARCLVSGRMAPVARTHPPLKGAPFPGTGAKLVSYEGDAFTSHHLVQGDNAPISELAARKYAAALNHLLERDGDGRRRSAVDIIDSESVVVFWTRENSDAPTLLLDLLAPATRASDAVRAAASVWHGMASRVFSPTPFYAVTLGVNSARVVVRDWFETTADEVKKNLDRWFEDLHLGDGDTEPLPLGRLLGALEAVPDARGDKRGISPGLAARLFRAALHGDPLPLSLLASAVQRMRLAPRGKEDARFVLRARVAIIKAVLRRQNKEIPVSLDETNTDRAYLLGRLFAALEKLQLEAAGKGHEPNATIRDRYYGAASTTPAAVFGRLLTLSMHHASKAKRDGRGFAEKVKSTIMDKLSSEGFPRTLRLEEQGLFAIGYYHQREGFYRKRDMISDEAQNNIQEEARIQ